MASNFKLIPSKYFLKQINDFSIKDKNQISDKLKLLKTNPFRYGTLEGYRFVFKIKLNLNNNYSRLIYAVYFPKKEDIRIFGIFERKNDYKDFKKTFKEDLRNLKK